MTLNGRGPSRIRTADVLAQFSDTPRRVREAAQALDVPQYLIGGHITFLTTVGKLTRVGRGLYVRTDCLDREAA
jgi:hypothetical protein